jgi:hypothetical protein
MSRERQRPVLLIAATLLAGCGDTGQPAIEHSAVAIGTPSTAVDVGDYAVTLEVARVALGPATFCASRAASDEQCPAAVAELAAVAAIDVLSPTPQALGRVQGFVGTVRSAGFGYGITWLNTQTAPTPAAATPGRHSAHLEGTATNKMTMASFRFVADVDIVPLNRGQHAVTTTGLSASIDERTARLEVRLDPNAWVAQIDFAELAAAGTATVTIDPKSRAGNALIVGMTSLAPPRFTWVQP